MRKILINIITLVILISLMSSTAFAASGLGCGKGFGPIAEVLCKISGQGDAAKVETGKQLNKVISTIIGVMTAVAALWFIFQFITAGYQWISSGGDKNNLEEARNKITNSLIGLILVVGAWIIMGVVGRILGLDILNPGKLLQTLGS